jgi:hypothetical protein
MILPPTTNSLGHLRSTPQRGDSDARGQIDELGYADEEPERQRKAKPRLALDSQEQHADEERHVDEYWRGHSQANSESPVTLAWASPTEQSANESAAT